MALRHILATASLALAACTAPAPVDQTHPTTTGQALAQATCPHRIVEANAWVNYMPGGGRSPRQLNVDVRFSDAADNAIILKSAATHAGETLVLEIRTVQTSQIPGRVAYREPVPDPPYKRISFFCRGGEIFSIDRIDKVY